MQTGDDNAPDSGVGHNLNSKCEFTAGPFGPGKGAQMHSQNYPGVRVAFPLSSELQTMVEEEEGKALGRVRMDP